MFVRAHPAALLALVLALSSIAACGSTDGAKTGEECAKSDLIAQCPPGSDPKLDAEATSQCAGSAEGSVIMKEGAASGSCEGEGSCRVLCQFAVPCECGVDRIDDQGVFCESCQDEAACGNEVCEGTEDATSCPQDCGAQCEPAKERCNGDARQICAVSSRWETVECPTGQQCSPLEDNRDLTECVPL